MQRLVLYSGCAAALALAVWLVVGTLEPGSLEPGDARDPAAQQIAAIPDAPPSPVAGSDAAVTVPPDPPSGAPLPQVSRIAAEPKSPRDLYASRASDAEERKRVSQATRDAEAAASADEDYAEAEPGLQARGYDSRPDAEAAWNATPTPIRSTPPEPERGAENRSRTPVPERAPPPVMGPIIALAPPVESSPTPTTAPDRIETPQTPLPRQESFTSSGTNEGVLLPPIEDFIDPTLPEPVRDVVHDDIQNKQQQAADWTN